MEVQPKMEKINIQEIQSDRGEEYKAFFRSGLIADENNFRISPDDDLHSPFPSKGYADSFTLGAFINDRIVGVVSFVRDGSDREKLRHKGILFRMYVDGNFRKRGIANLLIEELLRRVRLIPDIEQINLTVVADNAIATGLYEKFGFKTFGVEVNAIKWKNSYFTEKQMVLNIKS
ncbi:GNAT family N-acetyltransferase [Mucilaginibacter litoreus]|uniref:GNAT family N-acetyltransferase n=1 Tax=Mucilaginibacter litoreus TaxID=1048221 RepID=A0ABW3ARJ9_9SPHI